MCKEKLENTVLQGPETPNTFIPKLIAFFNLLRSQGLTGRLIKSKLSVMHIILLQCSVLPPLFLAMVLACLLGHLGYFLSGLDPYLGHLV